MKRKSPGYSGPMKCESYGYLQISWTFGSLRGVNLLDICESRGYSGPMKRKSPEYLGPMKHESPGYLGHMKCDSPGYSLNSWIFGAYEVLDVLGLYNKM